MITLDERTIETVKIYYEKSKQPIIKEMLPQKAQSIEEAISDYKKTLLPFSTSYGRIIKKNGKYIGDIWCYCINKEEVPNAMLSYCIFDTAYWNKGIATEAVQLFLKEVFERYKINTIGAFTFSDNVASIKVLEKVGFLLLEKFVEDERESKYYQYYF
mgnify:FL=1